MPFTLLSGMTPQYLINMTYASVGYGLLGWYLRAYPLPLTVAVLAAGGLAVYAVLSHIPVVRKWLI
ncbi:MAG: hypothetical protein ACOYIO_08330 [Eubacteriales bacterium]